MLVIDTNGDDSADYAISDNGDGTYTIYQDSDGDGEWDDEGQSMTRAELDECAAGRRRPARFQDQRRHLGARPDPGPRADPRAGTESDS